MKGRIVLYLSLFFSGTATAGVGLTGAVSQIYADASGNIAVKLDKAYAETAAANECPSNNGWAGNMAADPVLKSALIAAKTAGVAVTLSLAGCENNGNWIKLNAVYIK